LWSFGDVAVGAGCVGWFRTPVAKQVENLNPSAIIQLPANCGHDRIAEAPLDLLVYRLGSVVGNASLASCKDEVSVFRRETARTAIELSNKVDVVPAFPDLVGAMLLIQTKQCTPSALAVGCAFKLRVIGDCSGPLPTGQRHHRHAAQYQRKAESTAGKNDTGGDCLEGELPHRGRSEQIGSEESAANTRPAYTIASTVFRPDRIPARLECLTSFRCNPLFCRRSVAREAFAHDLVAVHLSFLNEEAQFLCDGEFRAGGGGCETRGLCVGEGGQVRKQLLHLALRQKEWRAGRLSVLAEQSTERRCISGAVVHDHHRPVAGSQPHSHGGELALERLRTIVRRGPCPIDLPPEDKCVDLQASCLLPAARVKAIASSDCFMLAKCAFRGIVSTDFSAS
jgi:hypothetical protein